VNKPANITPVGKNGICQKTFVSSYHWEENLVLTTMYPKGETFEEILEFLMFLNNVYHFQKTEDRAMTTVT
jgi:hypothetical protein